MIINCLWDWRFKEGAVPKIEKTADMVKKLSKNKLVPFDLEFENMQISLHDFWDFF